MKSASPARVDQKPNMLLPYCRMRTGMIDKIAAGMRNGMMGARLPIIRFPIARNVSGANESIDRLSPSHGPKKTPVTSAVSRMETSSSVLNSISFDPNYSELEAIGKLDRQPFVLR